MKEKFFLGDLNNHNSCTSTIPTRIPLKTLRPSDLEYARNFGNSWLLNCLMIRNRHDKVQCSHLAQPTETKLSFFMKILDQSFELRCVGLEWITMPSGSATLAHIPLAQHRYWSLGLRLLTSVGGVLDVFHKDSSRRRWPNFWAFTTNDALTTRRTASRYS